MTLATPPTKPVLPRSRWGTCRVCGAQVDIRWWGHAHGLRCFPEQVRADGVESFKQFYVEAGDAGSRH